MKKQFLKIEDFFACWKYFLIKLYQLEILYDCISWIPMI